MQNSYKNVDDNKIDPSIYRYIIKHTKKDQFLLLLLTLASMPFVYASLEVPKIIINSALGGVNMPDKILGFEIDQVAYLLVLCFIFLGLVLINGGLKYVINVYRGIIGERMLRRFRFDLFTRLLRFPVTRFKQVSQGEIIPMITAETEPLGGFIGDAFALPAFQGGLLITYLYFIFNQDFWLGLAAVVLYPPQLYIIPKLQRHVNQLAKKRVQAVRKFSDKVGETVSGVVDIHANHTSNYEKAQASDRLRTIYQIRFDIYKKKFFIKFLNNFLAQLTPFFFYAIGGYFVINGELSLGALVAVLAAYKDLASPWNELLKFYQITEDVRVKYSNITDQFQPDDMLYYTLQCDQNIDLNLANNSLEANLISYSEDGFVLSLDSVSFSIDLGNKTGILGLSGSGRYELARLLARIIAPRKGRIKIADHDISQLSESVLGPQIGYVDQQSYVFTGSVKDNLLYGLKNHSQTQSTVAVDQLKDRDESVFDVSLSENSSADVNLNWVDIDSAGFDSQLQFNQHIMTILDIIRLEDDIYQLGLYSSVDEFSRSDLAKGILDARVKLRQALQKDDYKKLVEVLDYESYNTNLTVAENLFFGVPIQLADNFENLISTPVVQAVLDKSGLKETLFGVGLQAARIMVEIFSDVPENSPLFERFNFVKVEDIPAFARLEKLPDKVTMQSLERDDMYLIMNLSFKLTVARHRLGLITPQIQQQITHAHKELRQQLGLENDLLEFYDSEKVAGHLTIEDNILFGRLAYGQANARVKVGKLIEDVINELGLKEKIIEVGLDYFVGVGGAKLNSAQRQKLTIARALIKNPQILIVNEATAIFNEKTNNKLISNILAKMKSKTVVWVLENTRNLNDFDHILVLDKGRLIAQGSSDEIQQRDDIKAIFN